MYAKKMGEEWMEEALEAHVDDIMEEIAYKPPKHVLMQARVYYQEPDGEKIYDKVGEFRYDEDLHLILQDVLFRDTMSEMLTQIGRAAADPGLSVGMGIPKAARVVAISISVEALFADESVKWEDGKPVPGIPAVLVALRNEDGERQFAMFPLQLDAKDRKHRPEAETEPPEGFQEFFDNAKAAANADPLSAFFGGLAEGGAPKNMKVIKAWEQRRTN